MDQVVIQVHVGGEVGLHRVVPGGWLGLLVLLQQEMELLEVSLLWNSSIAVRTLWSLAWVETKKRSKRKRANASNGFERRS